MTRGRGCTSAKGHVPVGPPFSALDQPHGETKFQRTLWASGPSPGLAVEWFSALAGVGRGWGNSPWRRSPRSWCGCQRRGSSHADPQPRGTTCGAGPRAADPRPCQQSACAGSLSPQRLPTRRRGPRRRGPQRCGRQEREGQLQGTPGLSAVLRINAFLLRKAQRASRPAAVCIRTSSGAHSRPSLWS